jgi:hypothetical protein
MFPSLKQPSALPKNLKCSVLATVLATVLAAGLAVVSALPVAAQQKSISVDWGNADIKAHVQGRANNSIAAALPEQEARLSKLKLPVLGFERVPEQAASAFGLSTSARPKRKLVMDDANPIWYQITERYGDVTITVEADLRLNADIPQGAKVFGGTPGANKMSPITVMDEASEPGMQGAIAEYTIYRYPNVPYRVTIECSRAKREYCRDKDAIAKDQTALKLISARPPG